MPVHNARNFGAVADSATDSTYHIQQAIDEAHAAGGGVVTLPPGVFIVSNLKIRSDVVLEGAGLGITKLRLRPRAPVGANVIQTPNIPLFTGKTATELLADVQKLFKQTTGRFTLRNMTLDGNKANNPLGGYALDIHGYGYRWEHLEVRDSGGGGIRTEWPPNIGSITAKYPLQCSHHDVRVHECSADGMQLGGPSDGYFNDLAVYMNGENGVWCTDGSDGTKFVNYHVWGSSHQRCFLVSSSGVNCANGTAERANTALYDIEGPGFVLVGGFQYSGTAEPNTIKCFRINSYTYRIDTRASRFGAGLVEWASDPNPGGYINVDGTVGVSSTLYTGTPNAKSFVRLQIRSDVVSLPLATNAYYHEPLPLT